MASTDFGALDIARKKVWAAEIWQAGRDANFWMSNGFVGKGKNNVVERITELTTTERGEQCIMQLVADLQTDGVAGDNTLEGNEEALFNDAVALNIDQMRQGVRSKGAMSEQRTVIRFRSTAKEKLSFWFADKIDELMFLTAAGIAYTYLTNGATRAVSQLTQLKFASDVVAPSSGRIRYVSGATSTASLTSTNTMSWNTLVSAQAYAKRKKMKRCSRRPSPWSTAWCSTSTTRRRTRLASHRAASGDRAARSMARRRCCSARRLSALRP
jgi:N4-gp56 family major capsid protein